MTELKDKSVVITGASSGIGAATARLLAQRGAYVFLGARRTERLEHLVAEIQLEGGKAEFLRVDVTQLEDVQRLVDLAEQTCGHLDVVVNNAGVMPLSALELLKVGEWNRMIDVNIRGVLHGIAAGLPIMKRQGYGQFVNVSSIGAHRVSPTAAV